MKKFVLLLAVASFAVVAAAQEEDRIDPAERHSVSTNGFFQNWFVGAGATWSAFYGVGDKSLVAPFHKFPAGSYYTGAGFSLSLGKWFTPVIGLRTKLHAWQQGKEEHGVGGDKYWTANEQVLLNVSTLFKGYDEQRLWSLVPFFGAGVTRNMTCNHYGTQLSVGLLNTFRLSRHWAANVELGWNSREAGNKGLALKRRTQHFALELGLTYHIGASRWKHVTDNDAVSALTEGELDALNAQLADAQAENDRLQQLLDGQPVAQPAMTVAPEIREVERIVSAPVSIFFELGKSTVIARHDMQNVAALAELAKSRNAYVVVTGYADQQTGTAEGNRQLSQQRADVVKAELVRLGVPAERIETVAAGGVALLTPADYNRRATVELK